MIIEFKKLKKDPISASYYGKAAIFSIFAISCCFFFFWDQPFAMACQSIPEGIIKLCSLIYYIFDPFFCVVTLSSLFFFMKFVQKRERAGYKLCFISLSLAISLFLASILKMIVSRSNPEWFFLHGRESFQMRGIASSFYSLPSFVSCTIGAIASSCSLLYPQKAALLLLCSFCMGIIPSLTLHCFFSDALLGLSLGIGISRAIFTVMKKEFAFFG
jgi:hypothetical protein